MDERKEWASSLAVCDQGKYLVAVFNDEENNLHSRMITLEAKNHSLHFLHILDKYDQRIPYKSCFAFFQRFGKDLLWVTASDSEVLTYCFDCKSGEMRKLVGKGVLDKDYNMLKFHRIDDKFYISSEMRGNSFD